MRIIFLFVAILTFYLVAVAATIHVPSEYLTIQEGIDASVNGDTVLVADGTYTGEGNKNLDYEGRAIVVISESGAENCIIDCEDEGRGVYFHSGEDQTAILDGFTIINGYQAFYGPESGGAGIRCSNNSNPTIQNCVFIDCSSDEDGGAIYCNYSANPSIVNCSFIGNDSYYGGGIYCSATSPTIRNCDFSGNSAGENGGGICCFYGSMATIENCTFMDNTAMFGGGVKCWNNSSPVIDSCFFSGNLADRGGGIDCAYDCSPLISRCAFIENDSEEGGGINIAYNSSPVMENCTICSNSATYNGGGINCLEHCSPAGANNIIWNNSAISGDQIYQDANSTFSCTYSDIQGGFPGAGNIDSDPLFYSTTGDSAYYLTVDSPCIDAGNPNSSFDPDSTVADMGAYYFDQSLDVEENPLNLKPLTFCLYPPYPNPFNNTVFLEMQIPVSGNLRLSVYDITGREVATLVNGHLSLGQHSVVWDADDLSSGVYFVRLETGDFTQTQKLLLIK